MHESNICLTQNDIYGNFYLIIKCPLYQIIRLKNIIKFVKEIINLYKNVQKHNRDSF